jgi:hypothetical protein
MRSEGGVGPVNVRPIWTKAAKNDATTGKLSADGVRIRGSDAAIPDRQSHRLDA